MRVVMDCKRCKRRVSSGVAGLIVAQAASIVSFVLCASFSLIIVNV